MKEARQKHYGHNASRPDWLTAGRLLWLTQARWGTSAEMPGHVVLQPPQANVDTDPNTQGDLDRFARRELGTVPRFASTTAHCPLLSDKRMVGQSR